MTTTTQSDGSVIIAMDTNDIESACRQFICACHPELATGFVIYPANQGMDARCVPDIFKAVKG